MHFATDMGWIMGPWTVVGVGALGAHDRLRRGRARLADARPALAHGRAGARHVARPLADARARAAPARRSDARPLVAAHVRDDGRAVEPRAVPLALRERRRLARADHQLHGRHRGRRLLPLADARRADQGVLGRRAGARHGDGRRRRRRQLARRHRRGRRARLPQAVPGHDARLLARPASKYLETYWSRIPGVWVHGDWASADADGFWFLHGRSDDTLNIAGKRIGPAELESAAVGHPAVREAAAIGVPHEVKGETAWIFCCLLPGAEATRRADESPAHVGGRARQGVQAGPRSSSSTRCRRRAPRRSCGARCARPRSATDPGDLSVAREPRVARRDRERQLAEASHSSPAAAAGSARTSRARSRRTAGRSSSPRVRATRSTRSQPRSAGARSSWTSPSTRVGRARLRGDRAGRPARRERRRRRTTPTGGTRSR